MRSPNRTSGAPQKEDSGREWRLLLNWLVLVQQRISGGQKTFLVILSQMWLYVFRPLYFWFLVKLFYIYLYLHEESLKNIHLYLHLVVRKRVTAFYLIYCPDPATINNKISAQLKLMANRTQLSFADFLFIPTPPQRRPQRVAKRLTNIYLQLSSSPSRGTTLESLKQPLDCRKLSCITHCLIFRWF